MSRVGRLSRFIAVALFLAVSGSADASWYDDYDAGLKAARNGQWNVVVQKMSSAIASKPNENNKERAYGTIFYNYHPYYYRGVAQMNLGRYEQAIGDLERSTGIGPEDLGRIEDLIQRAKTQMAASTPTTPVEPPVARPSVPDPAPAIPVPTIDGGLRQRAASAISSAAQRVSAAQQRNATASPQYQQAVQSLADARTRNAAARNNDDLNQVIAIAENAATFADSAAAPAIASTPGPLLTRPAAAASDVLADSQQRIRRALESYFNGDFDEAARAFSSLARELPNNGWVWAFLGAAQYSKYAFEADDQYKAEALESFRKAKKFRRWRNGLPEKYFSRKIRRAFDETAG